MPRSANHENVVNYRRQWGQMEARRRDELEFKPLRRGWCVGGEAFRRELLAQVAEHRGEWLYGAELAESAEARAE